jgi:Zn-dependent protease/CBS domain-containing protein
MESSFKLGRVAGIEVGIHYTWLVAFVLVSWSLAQGFFPGSYPGWSPVTYWLVGVFSALALFASVLIHELSHSFVARARGEEVDSITLFIFGGVSNLRSEPAAPRDEFLVSVVGPLTSFVLAAGFWLLRLAVAPGDSPVGAALDYLALINLILGGFNLLPGFPLDGGRILRSIVWAATRSLRRATQIAAGTGQAIAYLMIFWGLLQLLGGNFLGGLWIAFIGWFLNNAAETTRAQQSTTESLSGVTVAELANPQPIIAGPDTTVQDFVFEDVVRQGRSAVLVMAGGPLLGIATVTDAKKVPQDRWSATTLAEIMTPAPLQTVTPDTAMTRALELFVSSSVNQLPVVQDERVVGLLSRADVLRYLQLRQELHLGRLPGRPLSRPTVP